MVTSLRGSGSKKSHGRCITGLRSYGAGYTGGQATSWQCSCRHSWQRPAEADRSWFPHLTPNDTRVPRGFAVELAEVTDILEGHRRVPEAFVLGIDRLGAGEMEHGPEQHRGVAVREHEPIAVGPERVLRIEAHDAIPECVNQRRERHRRAGVPGLRLLYRIHREGANGVDR